MPSSISPSSSRWPRGAAGLALTALLAWSASAYYSLRVNPEIKHFRQTHRIKHLWAERLTRRQEPKVIVYGGSSCEFSIDGERLQERFGLPCVNLGRGAGMGAVVLTMAALEEARKGDTLIVAMEPGLITEPMDIPSLGIQFSLAAGHPSWIRRPLAPAPPVSWVTAALALRPGGHHAMTLLGKFLFRQPLYRYRLEDMRPSGWNQTDVRLPIDGPPGHGIFIPPSYRDFLRSLRDWCAQHEVRVAYSMPWAFTPAEKVAPSLDENLRFLLQMAEILPVLKDPRLGAHSVREHFSDTPWHLIQEAAAQRTDELGDQILHWRTWSIPELQALMSHPPSFPEPH